MEQTKTLALAQKQLRNLAGVLERRSSISQVQAKIQVIKDVQTDTFWASVDILDLETVRKELRDLIQFIEPHRQKPIVTCLEDTVIYSVEGKFSTLFPSILGLIRRSILLPMLVLGILHLHLPMGSYLRNPGLFMKTCMSMATAFLI